MNYALLQSYAMPFLLMQQKPLHFSLLLETTVYPFRRYAIRIVSSVQVLHAYC